MSGILSWIVAHPVPAVMVLAVLYLVVISCIGFIQGREISLWPPRIGGRKVKIPSGGGAGSDATGVFAVIAARKSVRTYLDKPVEPDKLNRIIEAARLAPSASNRQEWRFVIVAEKETVGRVAGASCIGQFIHNAQCIIAACADTDNHVMKCGQLSYPIDVAIALDHISLAAVALGLGTCWIGIFDEKKVKEILGIPDNVRVVTLMTLGYPADPSAEEKKRLSTGKIMMMNRWNA